MSLTIPHRAHFEELEEGIAFDREAVVCHPIYSSLRTIGALRVFMRTHVFAVWDFMSLLKTLQQRLTCTTVPWLPPAHPLAARLVNEMVLAEESDEIVSGQPRSHFELYLEAMDQIGADSGPVRAFVAGLRDGLPVGLALSKASAPHAASTFVLGTLATCELGTVEIASSFLLGREALVPAMFREIIGELESTGRQCPAFRLYLDRHVQIDGEEHGPMARQLLESLCGSDATRWLLATEAARAALSARRALWDGVMMEQAAVTKAVSGAPRLSEQSEI